MEEKPTETEVLPLDRYIRAVAICNSLALLASQGTMVQFIQRIAILTRLQKYWKKGYDTVTLSCADYDDGQDNDDDNGFEENVDDASIALQAAAALASVEHPDNWETHSNSTVDLKPDIHAVASEPELSEPDEKPERKSRKKPEADRPKRGRKPGSGASSQIYPCSKCGETFKYRSVLVRHENQKHKPTEDKDDENDDGAKQTDEPQPSVTTKDSSSSIHLKSSSVVIQTPVPTLVPKLEGQVYPHVRQSSQLKYSRKQSSSIKPKRVWCGTCGMGFDSQGNLTVHMRVHTGEKPYECRICKKTFAQMGTRNVHEKTHNAVHPHVCAICGHQFVQPAYLRYHMRVHTGERPFSCSVCGKTFRKQQQLKGHERVHTNERPYLCSHCTGTFKTFNAMKRHLRLHSSSSYCRCSVCDKGFSQLSNLRVHMRTHTGEKPYSCIECGRRFSHQGTFKKHVLDHERHCNGQQLVS